MTKVVDRKASRTKVLTTNKLLRDLRKHQSFSEKSLGKGTRDMHTRRFANDGLHLCFWQRACVSPEVDASLVSSVSSDD
jgi:hypothetical protein